MLLPQMAWLIVRKGIFFSRVFSSPVELKLDRLYSFTLFALDTKQLGTFVRSDLEIRGAIQRRVESCRRLLVS